MILPYPLNPLGTRPSLDAQGFRIYAGAMEFEILGSGTSHGIPVIGCACPVCASLDPKDTRYRASGLLRTQKDSAVLIDAGPEFRLQALRAGITGLGALLVTHAHADHIHGLDDVRIFTHQRDLPVYAAPPVIEEIRERFTYVFKNTQAGGGKPRLKLIPVEPGKPFLLGDTGIEAIAVPILHGELGIYGWRLGDMAYLTDCSAIPESSRPLLEGLSTLVIDALRERPHTTHFCFAGALEEILRIGPARAYLTHLCHDFSHAEVIRWIDEWKERAETSAEGSRFFAEGKKIEPAYDGLRFTVVSP